MRTIRVHDEEIRTVQYDSTGTYGIIIGEREYGEYACVGCANHRARELVDNKHRPSAWATLKAMVEARKIQNVLDYYEGNDDEE